MTFKMTHIVKVHKLIMLAFSSTPLILFLQLYINRKTLKLQMLNANEIIFDTIILCKTCEQRANGLENGFKI